MYGIVKDTVYPDGLIILLNDGTTHRPSTSAYVEHAEPSWDSLCEGMRLEFSDTTYEVVGRTNEVAFIVYVGKSGEISTDSPYTKSVKGLKAGGYKILNSKQQVEELTMEQVCKELGRVVKITK